MPTKRITKNQSTPIPGLTPLDALVIKAMGWQLPRKLQSQHEKCP